MIYACKFCEKEIPTPKLGDSWWCLDCQNYSFVMSYDFPGITESETLRIGNYHLIFFPHHKEANVVEAGKDGNHRIIHKFETNELTRELVVQWAKKLKTYVLFQ
jgi:hypothetical protein